MVAAVLLVAATAIGGVDAAPSAAAGPYPATAQIGPAPGQPNPITGPTVVYAVTFSEGVTGFEASDVDLTASSAGGPLSAAVTPVDSSHYLVTVSGMTVNGLIIANVPAGAATTISNGLPTTISNYGYFAWSLVGSPKTTVDQASFQADPTSTSPIAFDVIFSGPVTGFTGEDIDLSDSGAGGNLVAKVTATDASTYIVWVSGMTTAGSIDPIIPAGVASAVPGGQPSLAATGRFDTHVTWIPAVATPLAIGVPDDRTVPTDPGAAVGTVTFPEPTSTGGVAPLATSCDHGSGDAFPIGETVVTCTATDGASPTPSVATDSFTITVVDEEAPVLRHDDLVVELDDPTATGAVVDFAPPTVTDNSGDALTATCDPASGTRFALGTTTVTCTAADASGNAAAATFAVEVRLAAVVTTVPVTSSTTSTTSTTSSSSSTTAPMTTSTAAPSTTASGDLARTGSTPGPVAALGAALLVAGLALAGLSRRRTVVGARSR